MPILLAGIWVITSLIPGITPITDFQKTRQFFCKTGNIHYLRCVLLVFSLPMKDSSKQYIRPILLCIKASCRWLTRPTLILTAILINFHVPLNIKPSYRRK